MGVEHVGAAGGSEFPRQYLAADADCGVWETVEGYYRELVERTIGSKAEVERWLVDASELEACVEEERVRRYTASTCHTDNPELEQRYLQFVEQIEAGREPWRDKLLRRLIELPERFPLPAKRYEVLLRSARNTIELYREANVTLQTEEARQVSEYQKITGAMTCQYAGREQTLQQMARYLEEQNRQVREEAWRLVSDRYMQDAARLDEQYVRMAALRHQMAVNADCRDFRDYMFKRRERFDYSPEDCLAFHDAIEKIVVPAVQELAARRQQKLGLTALRPWDLIVDPDGRLPLRPFETVAQLVAGCSEIFRRVHPEFGQQFDTLSARNLLELESRKGKAPGGYQETFSERREPFIFMNAVGTDGDVRTLLHEGGHAFHAWACRNEPLLAYRNCAGMIEFAEVASMGMECLTLPHTGLFFGEEMARATREYFEHVVQLFPHVARIDAFQHHVYTHMDDGLERWKDYWQGLTRRFVPHVDYAGLEARDRQSWQRTLHVFEVPFYYVEYAIAQLGALQVWLNSRKDYDQAVAQYRYALALGGARPLPELFAAAGCRLDFSAKTLRPLIDAVMEEIARG